MRLDRETTQLWIASVGAIESGAGKFEGVRGMSVYVGGACLSDWPQTHPEQLEMLRAGHLKIRVSTLAKLVLREDPAST